VDKIYTYGMDDIKTLAAVKASVLGDKEASALMKCVLQQEE